MIRLLSKTIGVIFLTVIFCTSLSPLTLAVDTAVYDKPELQPDKVIKGIVTKVDEKSSQSWNVSVQDQETGNTVDLHIDKTTMRIGIMMKPKVGDSVEVEYNEQNNHAQSFLTTQNRSH